ncbi:MAG TPA: hypothetical protein PLA71_00750 [Saccharofermentans sp.]|nr:hypothetical protein [Saccharofermentans sp.]
MYKLFIVASMALCMFLSGCQYTIVDSDALTQRHYIFGFGRVEVKSVTPHCVATKKTLFGLDIFKSHRFGIGLGYKNETEVIADEQFEGTIEIK